MGDGEKGLKWRSNERVRNKKRMTGRVREKTGRRVRRVDMKSKEEARG